MSQEKLLQYINLRNDYESKQNIGVQRIITIEEQQLINDINNYTLINEDFKKLINSMNNASPIERENLAKKYLEQLEEPVESASLEEQEISKTFGIDISNIEHKFLNNGNEIFYFYDLKLNREVVLQNNKYGKNLVEQLKELQQENELFQTSNNELNTNNILEQQINKSDIELKMVTLNEIRNNQNIVNSLKEEDYNKLNYLINNYVYLNIKCINLENLIYIDNNNKLREVVYDKEKDRYYTDEPKTANYQEETQNIETTNLNHIEETVDNYNENYNIEDKKNYENESFDELPEEVKEQTKIYYDYPEILEKIADTDQQKQWQHYVDLYTQKLEQEKNMQNQDKPKQKVKTGNLNKKAGYVDALLLSLITGFTFGIFVTIIVLVLNK